MELPQEADESRVLVIYTGGTIGMLVGPNGYSNEPHFLTETLSRQSRFHDPLEDSLFSNSTSAEGYRNWSRSGTSSPETELFAKANTAPGDLPALLVRSSRPIGPSSSDGLAPDSEARNANHLPFTCIKVEENLYEARLPSLVTPRNTAHAKSGKRVRYAVLEWDPLLDSSNLETEDWVRLATEIELNYIYFDAFVILHGTDTMSYTSSALSFMLEDLGKTVILTGAQIPLSQLRNDAVENLLGALTIAGHYIIPECCIFFNHALYRGNRVSKVSSYDFNAFNSPNFNPLVNDEAVGIDIVVNWSEVIRPTTMRRFRAHKSMDSRVAALRLFPGISAQAVAAFLQAPMQGVVLETFGAGNAPQRPDLMAAFREACDRGVVIVSITQCSKGSVSDAYATGRSLLDAGVVPGGDMTPECALTKLAYLLSKPDLSRHQVRSLIRTPLRGELTVPSGVTFKSSLGENLDNIQGVLTQVVRLSSRNSHAFVPEIKINGDADDRASLDNPSVSNTWTPAEVAATEIALLPHLLHLAVSRDDVETLTFCLEYQMGGLDGAASPPADGTLQQGLIGGMANCIEPTSGRTPLHVAALNASEKCLAKLLEAGALVHLRDGLRHTALYYAARRGHEHAVIMLRQAGANLGGADIEGGYVKIAMAKAFEAIDMRALEIWTKAGANFGSTRAD